MPSNRIIAEPAGDRLVAAAAPTGSAELIAAASGAAGPPRVRIQAYNGGLIRPQRPQLDAPLVIDLDTTSAAARVALTLNHDSAALVGQAADVTIRTAIIAEGLITGPIDDPESPAGQVVYHARNGFVWPASVEAQIGRLDMIRAGQTVTVNGQTFEGPLYVARNNVLDCITLLARAADHTTTTQIAAAASAATQEPRAMNFESWLRQQGFDPATLSDSQRATLQAAYTAAHPTTEPPTVTAAPAVTAAPQPGDVATVVAGLRADNQRRTQVAELVRRFANDHPDRLDQIEAAGREALQAGWNPERFELHMLRELRPTVDARPTASRDRLDRAVVEAGLCLSGNLPNIERHYDPQTIEAARSRFRHGLTLGELLVMAAQAAGYTGPASTRNAEEILAAVSHGRRIQAGPSTYDLPGVLSNVANRFVREAFNHVDQAWRAIASVTPVKDFKPLQMYSMTGDLAFKPVSPGGELESGSLGELGYTNQASTQGRIINIDRRDLINDDLGVFSRLGQRLGRGGALAINRVFWAAFNANTAFFTTARNNYAEGADTALSLASLQAAEAQFLAQTDLDGHPIGIMPAILLVPTALSALATQLFIAQEIRDTTASTKYPTANVFQNRYKPVTSPYLQNTALGGSSTKWYLLANPGDLPVVDVCFLNGREIPTVEMSDADFSTLGMRMRGYHDFGVALQEYRAGVARKGTA